MGHVSLARPVGRGADGAVPPTSPTSTAVCVEK